jgi:hypothetical protein
MIHKILVVWNNTGRKKNISVIADKQCMTQEGIKKLIPNKRCLLEKLAVIQQVEKFATELIIGRYPMPNKSNPPSCILFL